MATDVEKALQELVKLSGNDRCAECCRPDPGWATCPLGIFICAECAKIHDGLAPGPGREGGTSFYKVQPITSKDWTSDEIKTLEKNGNAKSNAIYEKTVPPCYRRPKPGDPPVLFEQWILGKYDRLEFNGANQPSYLLGQKEGYLWKRGKEGKQFQKRRFILDSNDNTLRYYNKEGAKEPKAVLNINEINTLLVPDKVGHPNGMQLIFEQNNDTRSIFVYSDSGKDLIDWYAALRSSKLNFLSIAYPSTPIKELEPFLASEFVKEGWLNKAGPNPGDVYRRRWVSLDKCCLLYYIDPMSAFAKGEVFFDSRDDRYSVSEGIDFQKVLHSFTLHTPGRVFHFSADSQELMVEWMAALNHVISTAIPRNRRAKTQRKSSLRKTFQRLSTKSFNAD